MLQLVVGDDAALVVEDEEPCAGGALVDGSDEVWHPAVRSSSPVQIRVDVYKRQAFNLAAAASTRPTLTLPLPTVYTRPRTVTWPSP